MVPLELQRTILSVQLGLAKQPRSRMLCAVYLFSKDALLWSFLVPQTVYYTLCPVPCPRGFEICQVILIDSQGSLPYFEPELSL